MKNPLYTELHDKAEHFWELMRQDFPIVPKGELGLQFPNINSVHSFIEARVAHFINEYLEATGGRFTTGEYSVVIPDTDTGAVAREIAEDVRTRYERAHKQDIIIDNVALILGHALAYVFPIFLLVAGITIVLLKLGLVS